MAQTNPSGEQPEARRGLVGPFTGRQLAAVVGIVAAVALALAVATRPIASAPFASADPRPTQYAIAPAGDGLLTGSVAPSLALTGAGGVAVPLTDVNGAVVDLSALRGRPVWINFWASWCPPCQAETPVLRSVWEQYQGTGLAMIGISVQESTVADVRAYALKYGLSYTVAADLTGELFHRYHVYGLPTQFFIDASGVVRAIVQGPVTAASAAANLAAIGVAAPVAPGATLGSAAPAAQGSAAP